MVEDVHGGEGVTLGGVEELKAEVLAGVLAFANLNGEDGSVVRWEKRLVN